MGELFDACALDVSRYLRRLFSSRIFFAEETRGALFRDPVAYCMGALRSLRAEASGSALSEAFALMGQDLYHPPSVAGWPGGRAWFSSQRLIARQNFATDLVKGVSGPLRVRPRLEGDEKDGVLEALLPGEARTEAPLLESVAATVARPAYQLH